MKIKIEKGIKIPTAVTKEGKELIDFIQSSEHGDSFFLDCTKPKRQTITNKFNYHKAKNGKKGFVLISRAEGKGFRFWIMDKNKKDE